MDLSEIRDVLGEALPMRSPRLPQEMPARERVPKLEDHMLALAHVGGGLFEAQHYLRELIAAMRDAWNRLDGWQVAMSGPESKWTAPAIQKAKIKLDPTAYEAGLEAKRLLESVDAQIERFGREERTMSRAYTIITGS